MDTKKNTHPVRLTDEQTKMVSGGSNGGNTHINNLTGDRDETFSSAQSFLSANAESQHLHFTVNLAK